MDRPCAELGRHAIIATPMEKRWTIMPSAMLYMRIASVLSKDRPILLLFLGGDYNGCSCFGFN